MLALTGPVLLVGRDDGLWRIDPATPHTARRLLGDCGNAIATTALAADPDDPRLLFAGAPGALFRSQDGGDDWRSLPLPSPAPFVTAITLSPAFAEDGTLFLATLEDGVLRSDDRGDSWRRWNFGLIDLSVFALAASPTYADDETLIATTETALVRSENGGRAWRELPFPEPCSPALSLALAAGDQIWAGTEDRGLWHSTDAGQTWQAMPDISPDTPINALNRQGDDLIVVQPTAISVLRAGDALPVVTLPADSAVAAAAVDAATSSLWVQLQDGRLLGPISTKPASAITATGRIR